MLRLVAPVFGNFLDVVVHDQIHVNSNFFLFCSLRTRNDLSLGIDDGITYDVFSNIFSVIICI